jgi:hypothetical protein
MRAPIKVGCWQVAPPTWLLPPIQQLCLQLLLLVALRVQSARCHHGNWLLQPWLLLLLLLLQPRLSLC